MVDTIDHYFAPQLLPVAMNIWLICCLIIMLIILFLPHGIVPKSWSILCAIPFLWSNQSQYSFELTVLDVGQGQSIMVRTPEKRVMIDTGGYYDEDKFSVAEQIIRPYFSIQGIRDIDYLFLTHLDQDHSGAYEKLKKKFNFKQIFSSEKIEVSLNSKFSYCHEGQKIQLNPNVIIEVLSPIENSLTQYQKDKNENSCVLYIQVNHAQNFRTYLLMGDAGWYTEFSLLQKYPNLKPDVLVLGHHGSRHSSSYAFLEKLQPKLAIASAGFQNRYNHPHPVDLERLKDLNIPLLSTIESGSVTFQQSSIGEVNIELARQQRTWLER